MSIPRVKIWDEGQVLLASDLNAEFNNVLNAGAPLVSPLTAAWDLDGQSLIFDADADTSMNSSTDDRLDVIVNGEVDVRFTPNTFTLQSGTSQVITSGDISFTSGRLIGAGVVNLTSAGTVTLPTTSNLFEFTGTTDVSAFSSTPAGYRVTLRYTGSGLNLIHNSTSLILPYSTDYRLITNEVITFLSLGGGNYIMESRSGPAIPPGMGSPTPTVTPDTGFLFYDGSTVNASTYRALAKKLIPNSADFGRGNPIGAFTTDAITDTMTLIGHGLAQNDIVHFSNTGGALPTPLFTETAYYLVFSTPSTFQVSATYGGSAIDLTSAGSGTNSIHNMFVLPDLRGRYPLGADNMGGVSVNRVTATEADNLGQGSGAETHTLTTAEIPAHTHIQQWLTTGATGNTPASGGTSDATPLTMGTSTQANTGGGGAHNNMPPYQTMNWQARY